jgi:hypothetical protein
VGMKELSGYRLAVMGDGGKAEGRKRVHTSGAKAPVSLAGERPKAEALGYLEATARTTATADPCGMTTKRTSNNNSNNNNSKIYCEAFRYAAVLRCGGGGFGSGSGLGG